MRFLFLVALGLGLAWASPLGKMESHREAESTDAESEAIKAKLDRLHKLLAELSNQVGDAKAKVKEEVVRNTLEAGGKLEEPLYKDLDPSDVALLKEMRTYLQGLKNDVENQEKAEKREQKTTVIPEDVKELLQKYKSRVQYLKAALEDEAKHKGSGNPEDIPKRTADTDFNGAFGQFEEDKEKKEEWKDQPIQEDLLGGKLVGTKFVPDEETKTKTLNAVEKRLLDTLKYARENGVDIKDILNDLQQKRGK